MLELIYRKAQVMPSESLFRTFRIRYLCFHNPILMLLAYHPTGMKIRLWRCENQGLPIASHMPRNYMAYVKRLRGICQSIVRHMLNDENDAVFARLLLGSCVFTLRFLCVRSYI